MLIGDFVIWDSWVSSTKCSLTNDTLDPESNGIVDSVCPIFPVTSDSLGLLKLAATDDIYASFSEANCTIPG